MRTLKIVVYWLVALKLTLLGAILGGEAFKLLGAFTEPTVPLLFTAFLFVMGVWYIVVPLRRRLFVRP